ncbi:MAG: hypothetical protein ABI823_13540 [Bryobacteraceae bacterium]
MKILAFLLFAPLLSAADSYLYKALFVQAAPGKVLELIDLYKSRMPVYDASGDERPLWMRHSQGDRWDLLLLFPMNSWSEYFAAGRVAKRNAAYSKSGVPQSEFAKKFYEDVAWHEEVFVEGPPLADVKKAFAPAGFFHVEIFISLPGKQADLYKEREMENAYQVAIGRPRNLIFTHDQGAAWDLFTVGAYRDLPHFAESASVPKDKQEAAAKQAGFRGADFIGPYLRSLISLHHDSLCTSVK